MRKTAIALVALTALGGCMSFESNSRKNAGPGGGINHGVSRGPAHVPGLVGPMGTPVPMVQPYASTRPTAYTAQGMLDSSQPLSMVQINNPHHHSGIHSGIQLTSGMEGPGGVIPANVPPGPPGSGAPPIPMPPGGLLSPPGMPPIPGMPGGMPGALASGPPGGMPGAMMHGPPRIPYNAVAAVGAMADKNQIRFPIGRTQVRFVRPSGMKVSWFTTGTDGKGIYSDVPIETPGRYNFAQAAIYRLKLTSIDARPGLEVYPTLEVVPANPKTEAFLAHSAVPVDFTPEDFRQIAAGNYVVKVIYLPDPQNQDLASIGPDEIISTQLEPGADPIAEAQRRGSILLIIRMGNLDQEAPNTPPINAPAPGASSMGQMGQMTGAPAMVMMPHQMQMPQLPAMGPGSPPMGRMLPYGTPMPAAMNPAAGGLPQMPMMPPQMGAGQPFGTPMPWAMPRSPMVVPPQMQMPQMPGMMPPTTGMMSPAPGGPVMVPPRLAVPPPPPPQGVVPASNRPPSSVSAASYEPGAVQLTSGVNSSQEPPMQPMSQMPLQPMPTVAPRPTGGSFLGGLMPAMFQPRNTAPNPSDCNH